MKIEIKSQSTIFHGTMVSVELVDMAEQGFHAMVWKDRNNTQYLASKATLKSFTEAMTFVVETVI